MDNNSTTKPLHVVCEAVVEGIKNCWGNPSSTHSKGQEAASSVELARTKVADFLGVNIDWITFTSGATEANEVVLRYYLANGYYLITSVVEHPAITGLYQKYSPEMIQYVPIENGTGEWSINSLEKALKFPAGGGKSSAIIALAWANGETGVIQDLKRICELASKYRTPILVDATQIVGRDILEVPWGNKTYFTFSGHKLHSPKGIGVLVQSCPPPERLVIQVGGEQEGGIRGGTENVPGIIGLGIACEYRKKILPEAIEYLKSLRDRFEEILLGSLNNIYLNGVKSRRIPNTSNITFSGIDGMALVARLADKDIMCSQVSACTSGAPGPSKTLLAMGLNSKEAFASVRFAFSMDNNFSEVDIAAKWIVTEVSNLRSVYG